MGALETYHNLELHSACAEETRLRQLHRWLTLGSFSSTLGALVFVVPAGVVFTLLKCAAVAFSPYMLWRLWQSGRYGWVVGFAIAIGITQVWTYCL